MKNIIYAITLCLSLLPFLSLAGRCNVKFNYPRLGRARVSLYDPERLEKLGSRIGVDEVFFDDIPTPASNKLYALVEHKGLFRPIYDIPCHDGEIYEVNDVASDLRVLFPGVNPEYVRVYTMDGPEEEHVASDYGWAIDSPVDEAYFTVLRGHPYKLSLKDGPSYLHRIVEVIENVTIVDGLVCDVIVKKEHDDDIKMVKVKTLEKEETIIETEPDGTTREVHLKVLKNEYIVEVHTTKTVKTILTNCTNTTEPEVPVGGDSCEVTLNFGKLTVDNVAVIGTSSVNLIFEDFDVPNNITLDLVDNENYFAIVFYRGCPTNVTFNCSTPIVDLAAWITIEQYYTQDISVDIICSVTGAVIDSIKGPRKEIIVDVLLGRYIIRIRKDGKMRRFHVDISAAGEKYFVYTQDFLFPYITEEDDFVSELNDDYPIQIY